MNQIPNGHSQNMLRPKPQPQKPMQPRPQPKRQSPPSVPTRKSPTKYPKGLVVSFIVTIILLIISLMVLSIVLLVGPTTRAGNDDGGGKDKNPPQTEQTQETPTNRREAKFLSLPSATAAGGGPSASSTVQIEGVRSACAIVVDRSTNTALAEKEANTRVYPASMTKVMTVLVACENAQNPTDLLMVTDKMLRDLVTGNNQGASTIGGWQAGDQITVEDALFLVNYKSDTIACWLLESYIPDFIGKMNAKAQELGLTNTHFVNSTGLHHQEHYTTCREMATIMHAALNNPAARKIVTSYQGYNIQVYRDGTPTRSTTQYAAWFSDNDRLNDNKWAGGGSDMMFIGGKTGWENIPQACFVTVAMDDVTKKEYICVTVGRIDETQPSVSASQSTADAKYIYRNYAEGN